MGADIVQNCPIRSNWNTSTAEVGLGSKARAGGRAEEAEGEKVIDAPLSAWIESWAHGRASGRARRGVILPSRSSHPVLFSSVRH
jgi:hypothetical protein